jgi:transposase
VWHLPFGTKGVRLWVTKRRFWCLHAGCEQTQPFTESFESLDLGQHRTHALERYIYRLAQRMPYTEVVKELARYHIPISDNTVRRVYQRLAQAEVEARPSCATPVIGIDEFSIRKQHAYGTIITDPQHRRVVDTFEKRDKETVVGHLERLPHKEAIQAVVIDMSGSFRSAVQEALPGRALVADKFHVVARVIQALDEVRKRVQRAKPKGEKRSVFRLRYRLRRGREKLNPEEREALDAFLDQEPELRMAYELKEAFHAWYRLEDRAEAEGELKAWCDEALASGLPEMVEVVGTLRNWWDEILNYFTWRCTNGFTEGKNNRIKVLKRQAYGYRDFEHFRLRILTLAA